MPLDKHNCLYMSVLKTTKLQSFQRKISLYNKWDLNDEKYRKTFRELMLYSKNDLQNGFLI